jgi:hypothetical protein
MKKIIAIIVLATVLVSCTKSEFAEYDNVNGQTLLKFEATSNVPVQLPLGTTSTGSAIISSSNVSDTDRTVQLSLDEDNTTFPLDLLEFDNTVVIPAGEYTAEFPVTVTDLELDFTETYDIAFNIDGASNFNDVVLENTSVNFVVTITCEVPEDFMVGEYAISDVTGTVGPGNGTVNFEPGTVTLVADGTSRLFQNRILPAFVPAPQDIVINLNCDVFQLGDVVPGLQCTANVPYIFTATERVDSSPYSVEDGDASFIINYVEDPNGSCGGPFISSFSLTKL